MLCSRKARVAQCIVFIITDDGNIIRNTPGRRGGGGGGWGGGGGGGGGGWGGGGGGVGGGGWGELQSPARIVDSNPQSRCFKLLPPTNFFYFPTPMSSPIEATIIIMNTTRTQTIYIISSTPKYGNTYS